MTYDCMLKDVVVPRTHWFPCPMDYKFDEDYVTQHANILLFEPIDKNANSFGTYDKILAGIHKELKTLALERKTRRMSASQV